MEDEMSRQKGEKIMREISFRAWIKQLKE